METSQPLVIESFSESWLLNTNNGFNGEFFLSSSEDFTFTATDYSRMKSARFMEEAQYNFKFDIPSSQSPPNDLVHADDLFFNGLLKPTTYVNPSKDSMQRILSSSFLRNGSPAVKVKRSFLGKLRKSSEKIKQKCLRILLPLRERVGAASARKRNRVGDIRDNSLQMFHRGKSTAAYTMVDEWSDFHMQSPIYEAVLHCKKSIGGKEDGRK